MALGALLLLCEVSQRLHHPGSYTPMPRRLGITSKNRATMIITANSNIRARQIKVCEVDVNSYSLSVRVYFSKLLLAFLVLLDT